MTTAANIPYPESIGTLNPSEAAAFSAPFSNDWGVLLERQRIMTAEMFRLFDARTEHEGILLPPTHTQFLPAVQLAVEHEKTVRGERRLKEAILTARQSVVGAGQSQQGGYTHFAHRDGPTPDYFYTVSDTNPTQYYPHIADPGDGRDVRLAEADLQQAVTFQPFDIVWASAMMYHRSPPVKKDTLRTFLRLTFRYNHGTRPSRR